MIYFDMDGVLAKYDWDGYKLNADGIMKFEEVGSHYFLHVEPDEVAINFFKLCLKNIPDDTYIITSVSSRQDIRFEQIIDKMTWLHSIVPQFDVGSKFIAVSSNKRDFVTGIRGMSLNRTDILIDDYNPNLYKWLMTGGTAVKYLNGINSAESWKGQTLSATEKAEDLYLRLGGIIVRTNKY